MKETLLILGATSGIGKALARELASRGHDLILAGRSAEELQLLAEDLRARHVVKTVVLLYDALETGLPERLVKESTSLNGNHAVAGVILCHGVMHEQDATEADLDLFEEQIRINFTSAVTILQAFANTFKERGSGWIVGISSVAGDRGRGSNYHYGATKAGLTAFLDGLRHRMTGTGVKVLTVKPGFVATPMTLGKVDPESPLCASPVYVAARIAVAMRRGGGSLYVSWHWRYIMAIVRHLPEWIFTRTKF